MTQEQRLELAKVLEEAEQRFGIGRRGWLAIADAAVAHLAPRMPGEPSDDDIRRAGSLTSGPHGLGRSLFANRLAEWTTEPDAAVEAVQAIVTQAGGACGSDITIAEIVAAVREADRAKGAR